MKPDFTEWIGRTDSLSDVVTAAPARALAATLETVDVSPKAGAPLPPLWHWLYFLPAVPTSELAADGHPHRGGFLPPVDLPRRMWAGGRFRFFHPLRIGETARRSSTITNIEEKRGRSGRLVFVVVRHEFRNDAGLAMVEEQDIVYREGPGRNREGADGVTGLSREPTPAPDWRRSISPDVVLLFRYSALTFNGHRIHYDRDYATGTEGYPGLVVHGPLIATLLLDLVRRHRGAARVARFQFRARRALYDTAPFEVCGRDAGGGELELWASPGEGVVAVRGSAAIEEA